MRLRHLLFMRSSSLGPSVVWSKEALPLSLSAGQTSGSGSSDRPRRTRHSAPLPCRAGQHEAWAGLCAHPSLVNRWKDIPCLRLGSLLFVRINWAICFLAAIVFAKHSIPLILLFCTVCFDPFYIIFLLRKPPKTYIFCLLTLILPALVRKFKIQDIKKKVFHKGTFLKLISVRERDLLLCFSTCSFFMRHHPTPTALLPARPASAWRPWSGHWVRGVQPRRALARWGLKTRLVPDMRLLKTG